MHTKTDSSEATSLSPSPPSHSPRRPVYYVQSPSRDSHDGEKTATSFHSTPTASPPHSHSSVGHHSRESSSTRFSGSLKPGSGKITPSTKPGHKQISVIDEEGFYDDENQESKGVPRRCYFVIFIFGFFVLFGLFSLILWGVSKPQKPEITVKSIKMETFVIQAGSDSTGVATDMVTMNSTVKLVFRNTASFFGVHVGSTPVDLSFSQITLASGAIKKFYQSRKSRRTLTISVHGNRVPLYGSGANLSSNTTGSPTLPVALKLNMVVKSKAYVLGKLVKPKFKKKIECSIVYDPKKRNAPISVKNSCTYK
ncbi:Late embryogenesis abundant protein, LEA-14 [Heracleum sosnowskyi]|uniref:Late embryogenesis abundant protein, LEA-14 n=1 Tax=Heracleum sosnowskyi TaxID=360622 RepID=A0AAD8MZB7_9APIA|nr:Late embryogenesis abundant protein, LEA-14 [Heracleum sosnowskyi]